MLYIYIYMVYIYIWYIYIWYIYDICMYVYYYLHRTLLWTYIYDSGRAGTLRGEILKRQCPSIYTIAPEYLL
jgi:hypothetical protein